MKGVLKMKEKENKIFDKDDLLFYAFLAFSLILIIVLIISAVYTLKHPPLCPRCNSRISDGLIHDKYCDDCGYKLLNICDNCEYENDDSVNFCIECGSSLDWSVEK